MLFDVEIVRPVVVPAKNLVQNGLDPQCSVLTYLLKQLRNSKADERCGYFLAVTKVKSIGPGELEESATYFLYKVTFCCRTFLPVIGEVMLGVVYNINRRGVFLKCGPMKYVYLSSQKMPNYNYVGGENPFYLHEDLSRIDNQVVVCFMVYAVRWTQKDRMLEREFEILATLEGDCLGPISLPRYDGLEI